MSSHPRQQKIAQYKPVEQARILEIGALDSPTYTRPAFNVKYLDFASTAALAEKGGANPRYAKARLVEVDFICPTPIYSEFITEQFDLVIANHVIEHIPDSIRWLAEINKILAPSGVLFLSVPDKRYTFDISRRTTDFIDLLRNYREQIKKPDFYHILQHFYYHKDLSAAEIWQQTHTEKIKKMRFDPKTALAVAEKHAAEAYADVHCHVFTQESFKQTYEILIELAYVPLKLEEVTQTAYLSNEFYAVFSRQI